MTYELTLYEDGPASLTVKGPNTGKHYTFYKGKPTTVEGVDYYGLQTYAAIKFPEKVKELRRFEPLDHHGFKGASYQAPSKSKYEVSSEVSKANEVVAAKSKRTLAEMKAELAKEAATKNGG